MHVSSVKYEAIRAQNREFSANVFMLLLAMSVLSGSENMTFRRALALILMSVSLASCNNSSSECSTCGPKPVNLQGSVSGLVGFRLTLQNGSTALSTALNGPDANGNQTFGTAATNTAYNITVMTQPTSPSQTCVVANGVGTTGNGNVTDIAVSCTTNAPRFL